MAENFEELQYLDLVRYIMDNGTSHDDRTGVGTKSIFSANLSFDLNNGFPLLTTKKINFKHIVTELLWFLRGDTNVRYLHEHGCHIWDEWADENGDLGPVYGKQWREWEGLKLSFGSVVCGNLTVPSSNSNRSGEDFFHFKAKRVDQISNLQEQLRDNPNSRRLLVVSYNPAEIPETAPPACHTMFQLYARDGKLSMQMYQRSADLMIGVPYNIASYALLLKMLAQVSGLKADKYHHVFGDVHIYKNHFDGVEEQLSRTPKPFPKLTINQEVTDIFNFKHEDFKLEGYNPDKFIKFPIAV